MMIKVRLFIENVRSHLMARTFTKKRVFSLEYEFCASKTPPMNDTIVITPDGIFKEIVVFLEYELCATQCNVIGYEQSWWWTEHITTLFTKMENVHQRKCLNNIENVHQRRCLDNYRHIFISTVAWINSSPKLKMFISSDVMKNIHQHRCASLNICAPYFLAGG